MDYRGPAIILKRTNYGEYDRILQCITPDGKKEFVARGVRKEKSKLAGSIELFSVSEITIHWGRSSLGILTSARLTTFYSHILEDYDNLQFAYEATKLTSSRSEHVDSPELFDILNQTLGALNQNQNLALIKTWFYLNLSQATGTDINLSLDSSGKKLQPDQKYAYDTASESFTLNPSGDITSTHIKFLRLLVTNSIKTASNVTKTSDILPTCLYIAKSTIKI